MADPRSNGNGHGRATGSTALTPDSPLHTPAILYLSTSVLCVCDAILPEHLPACPGCGSVERIPMSRIVQPMRGRG